MYGIFTYIWLIFMVNVKCRSIYHTWILWVYNVSQNGIWGELLFSSVAGTPPNRPWGGVGSWGQRELFATRIGAQQTRGTGEMNDVIAKRREVETGPARVFVDLVLDFWIFVRRCLNQHGLTSLRNSADWDGLLLYAKESCFWWFSRILRWSQFQKAWWEEYILRWLHHR